MANRDIIRALPIYINGKKIATVQHGTYDIGSGAELALGLVEGYLGHMTGWSTCRMNPSVIVPIKGMRFAVEAFLFDNAPFAAGIPANGVFQQVQMRVVGVSYRWDWRSGVVTGDLSFEGGQPEIVSGIGV